MYVYDEPEDVDLGERAYYHARVVIARSAMGLFLEPDPAKACLFVLVVGHPGEHHPSMEPMSGAWLAKRRWWGATGRPGGNHVVVSGGGGCVG